MISLIDISRLPINSSHRVNPSATSFVGLKTVNIFFCRKTFLKNRIIKAMVEYYVHLRYILRTHAQTYKCIEPLNSSFKPFSENQIATKSIDPPTADWLALPAPRSSACSPGLLACIASVLTYGAELGEDARRRVCSRRTAQFPAYVRCTRQSHQYT